MERGLSQQALATKAKISRGYLARLEAAEQDPTLGVLERLAKALGLPVTALLGNRNGSGSADMASLPYDGCGPSRGRLAE
jgi:transcriptional regulator with XRE-family HTH domain